MKYRWFRVIAAIGLGGGLALAAPALPAVGEHSPPSVLHIEVGDEGTIVAKGAGVFVPVEVTCPAGDQAFVNVELTQARGRRVTNGFAREEVTCTGDPQVVEVLLTPFDGAFKKGGALARASVAVCERDGFFSRCAVDEDVEEIRLR
jgi:hypothetical protein